MLRRRLPFRMTTGEIHMLSRMTSGEMDTTHQVTDEQRCKTFCCQVRRLQEGDCRR